MMNLNKIRSMKTLETMRNTLTEFLNFDSTTMIAVYAEEYRWGEEDYEADKDSAAHLLEQIEHREKSLGRHLAMVSSGTEEEKSDADSGV